MSKLTINEQNPSIKLLVYGSLLNRGINFTSCLKGKAAFLGKIITEPKFAMWDLGRFPIITEGNTSIVGEVWEVRSDLVLQRLLKLGEFLGEPMQIDSSYGKIYMFINPVIIVVGKRQVKTGDWHRRIIQHKLHIA